MIAGLRGIIGSMAYETDAGTPFLSFGEMVGLTKGLRPDAHAAGLADIFHGQRLSNADAQAALEAARADAGGDEQVHSIIDRGMDRLAAAA